MLPDRKKKTAAILFGVALTVIILAGLLAPMSPVQASPAYQLTEFPTPTPGPDGRIIYTVQEGDTLWRISAVAGVSLDQIRQLNSMSADAVIRPGQVLLLGVVEAVAPTLEPGATVDPATLPTPTPTQLVDASSICALLYLDANGDAIRQPEEIALADGEVSVTERLGAFSDKGTTEFNNDTDPLCFENIPPGEYIITMALPGGFNRTTTLSVTVDLLPGDISFLNFGAQPTEAFEPLAEPIDDGDNPLSGNLLVAIIGATLLLAGAGVGVWAIFNNRRRYSMEDRE